MNLATLTVYSRQRMEGLPGARGMLACGVWLCIPTNLNWVFRMIMTTIMLLPAGFCRLVLLQGLPVAPFGM